MIRSFRKINLLLDRRQKLTMAGLVLVMLLGAILEALGITMANVSILKNGKAKAVRIETLNKLCRALDCQPGDLFEYVADEEERNEPI